MANNQDWTTPSQLAAATAHYNQALEKGDITAEEHGGFMRALRDIARDPQPKASDWAPYDKMPEFQEGFEDYQKGSRHEKYSGLKRQAYDRGQNHGYRLRRWQLDV